MVKFCIEKYMRYVFLYIFYYLCNVNNPLEQLGNIPVTAAALESLFPNIRGGNQKIRLLERDKDVIRLKRGLYVCSPQVTGIPLSTELIANHLYAPSYVSMSSALRYYGLIPEEVYAMQSMTLKHSRDFNTPLGRYEYTRISKDSFHIGLSGVKKAGYAFVIATPEKALCDLIANSAGVNLRYPKDAAVYLEEDVRMEMSDFRQMNPAILEAYAKVGKKGESVRILLKLLKR